MSDLNPLILAIASAKGGVGKSTTTACLAGYYAWQGQGVHLIDVTAKRTISRWLGRPHTPSKLITLSAPGAPADDEDASNPKPPLRSQPDPDRFDDHLAEVRAAGKADVIIIDVAGAFEQTALIAMARAHFTIVPMQPNEADISEGRSLMRHADALYASFAKTPTYRVLVTMLQPVNGGAVQAFGLEEIRRLELPRFETMIHRRAVYAEIGITHQPPHFADPTRGDTVQKARLEIAALAGEIRALTSTPETVEAVA